MMRTQKKHRNPYWAASATAAGFTVVLLAGFNAALLDTGIGNALEFCLGAALGLTTVMLCAAAIGILLKALHEVPAAAIAVILGALFALGILYHNAPAEIARTLLDEYNFDRLAQFFMPDALSLASLASLVLASACIAGLASTVRSGRFSRLPSAQRVLVLSATAGLLTVSIATLFELTSDGVDPYPDDGAAAIPLRAQSLPGDPSAAGPYAIQTLTYGAGPNPRRPEFAGDRTLESRAVDASKILPQWTDFKQKQREKYWGFGLDQAPLNGRVWLPEGDGPFPLVLIVHGNHGMEDYSDDGYAYLGELLASRGFIAVSVDQNYINGTWSGDFQGKEMAARAWLLLEHVALWHDWNATIGHVFESKVDTANIALVGHSRGGEAVSIAHRFNDLPAFPDDATVAFDYGFNIHSLVAIAQVDQRYHRRVKLQDVNFFTIHGSYDSDEPAYHGLRQMNRITYSGTGNYIKSGVYLHGANHGQFNTGWGRYDYSPPGSWRLNTAPIIPGADQRQVAKTYVSAFLEATLHGDLRYLPALKDPRHTAQWLSQLTLVNQFSDSSFHAIADFEEDIDPGTASLSGATIEVGNVVLWREEPLKHRDERLQGSNALVVGWREPGAFLDIKLKESLPLLDDVALVFSVSGSLEALPQTDKSTPQKAAAPTKSPPDIAPFSVELELTSGRRMRVQVADYAQLIPPVRVQYLKNATRNRASYNNVWEPVLQFVEIPVRAFLEGAAGTEQPRLASVRLLFDQAAEGILILDNIGMLGAVRGVETRTYGAE